jgi:NitT/TauT family transport system permease protein
MGVALLAGLVLGVASGLWWQVDGALSVSIEFLRPIPSIALIPLAVILFGLQLRMQVFLVALPCTWPIFIATRHAVRGIDPLWRDVAMILGLGRTDLVWRVVVPAAVPGVITGIRTASSIAIVVAVGAELVSGSPGLGSYLTLVGDSGNVAASFAATIVAGVLGLVIDGVLRGVERLVAGWQEQSTEARRS